MVAGMSSASSRLSVMKGEASQEVLGHASMTASSGWWSWREQ